MQSVTAGRVTLTSCEYQPPDPRENQGPDDFPEFLVTGTVRLDNGTHDFVRKVSLEFDGRDVEQEYVSGLLFDPDSITGLDEIETDLYSAIYATDAFKAVQHAYESQ